MKDSISLFKAKIVKWISKLIASPLPNLIIFGLVLRLLLAPFSSDPSDIQVLYIVTNNLLAGLNVYTTNSFSYPPLWAYIEFPAFRVASLFASPKSFGVRVDTLNVPQPWKLPPIIISPLFNVLCKLPLIAADLLIGFIIYDIVKEKRDEKLAKISFILWFFNPLVIGIDAVQGQFDVLPTLITVLSFCLFLRREYFASGLAIGLGALFKIYPVFLVPLYLFSVAAVEIKVTEIAKNLRRVLAGCLKFLIGMLVSVSVFLVPLFNSNLIHDVFARTQVIPSFGGLTPFSIVLLPGLEWLFQFLVSNSSIVSLMLLAICFAVIVFIGFISSHRREDFLKTFVFAHIAAILTIYVTSLTVNPQHALWVLPFLVLSYGLYQHNYIRTFAFSTSALLILVGLNGPAFFYPLSYAPFVSPQIILNSTYSFGRFIGWGALLAGSVLGVVTLLLCLKGTITTLLEAKRTEMSNSLWRGNTENGKSHLKLPATSPTKILMVFFLILILGQSLAYTQPLFNQTVKFEVLSPPNINQENIEIDYRIESGNYPTDIQIIATATDTTQQIIDKEILIYYDDDYPSLAVSRARWTGLLDHIPIELQLRSYQGAIKIVNATGLKNEMQTNFDAIVIIPSGVFPATVHAANQSLVGNWIRAGGTLIWIGEAFAYFSGYSGQVVHRFSTEALDNSQNQTLGFVLFNESLTGDESFAQIASNFSNALDLQYTLASTSAYISQVLSIGGIVLGKITESQNARTSIASMPIGLGHLILFGGGVGTAFTATGEDVVAHDIAQILCSGALFSVGTITYNVHELSRNEVGNGTITVSKSIGEQIWIIVAAFSKSPYVYYFSRKSYAVNFS